MKIDEILKIDTRLKLINKENELEIETISNTNEQVTNSVFFVSNKKFWDFFKTLENNIPGSIIIDEKFFQGLDEESKKELSNKKVNVLTSSKATLSICTISKIFYNQKLANLNYQVDGRKIGTTKIHPSSRIAENVFIGENVEIGEDCIIMSNVSILPNSKIGNNVVIYPNCSIYANTQIGNNCRIHANTAIGSDGFGYHHDSGTHHKIWHFGGVVIGHDVEMGSGCTIDQGTFSPTRIGDGSKLDNQVHIAHNVHVGRGVILCGQVGLAGSAKAGDYCVFGGKSGLSDGVEIGKGCQVGGTSIATTNWEDGSVIGGFPARPLKEWLRGLAYVRKNSAK